MHRNDKSAQESLPKKALSTKDKAQIGAASFGCAFFLLACIMAYDAKDAVIYKKVNSFLHYPSIITGRPFRALLNIVKSKTTNLKTLATIWALLTAISSGALAGDCGYYIYKKIN